MATGELVINLLQASDSSYSYLIVINKDVYMFVLIILFMYLLNMYPCISFYLLHVVLKRIYYPGCYEFEWRAEHSTIVISDSIYCWGGNQKDLPMVHDNEDKRQITSSVNILDLPTFQWERKLTTGNPPSGMLSYACTNLQKKILYFGGCCRVNGCFHNNLYELNSLTNKWEEIASSTPDTVPMRKYGCGMMSYSTNGEDNFLLLGGYGQIPTTKQTQSQYLPHPTYTNLCYTNETHTMCVSSSPGIT